MKQSLLIKPMMNESYPTATHGEGVYLYDDTGKKYIDGSSGAVTASIGHAVPEIIEALHKQAKKVSLSIVHNLLLSLLNSWLRN
jgi:adenosylmethionine-8-amino-7-oxononanoate aminotransferase